jgi:hypothetical protein
MKISEALSKLAPYGVENIEKVNPILNSLWRITQNGKTFLFGGDLEYVVEALDPECTDTPLQSWTFPQTI